MSGYCTYIHTHTHTYTPWTIYIGYRIRIFFCESKYIPENRDCEICNVRPFAETSLRNLRERHFYFNKRACSDDVLFMKCVIFAKKKEGKNIYLDLR